MPIGSGEAAVALEKMNGERKYREIKLNIILQSLENEGGYNVQN